MCSTCFAINKKSTTKCCWRNLTMIVPSVLSSVERPEWPPRMTGWCKRWICKATKHFPSCCAERKFASISHRWHKLSVPFDKCRWQLWHPRRTSVCPTANTVRTYWQPGSVWRNISASRGKCSTVRSIACDCLLSATVSHVPGPGAYGAFYSCGEVVFTMYTAWLYRSFRNARCGENRCQPVKSGVTLPLTSTRSRMRSGWRGYPYRRVSCCCGGGWTDLS